jgi:hypothetical protein
MLFREKWRESRMKAGGFSRPIDLHRFERESKRLLFYGFLFAVLFNTGLVLIMPPREHPSMGIIPQKPDRIIHADIIMVQPQPSVPYVAGSPRFTPRPLRPQGIFRSIPTLPGMPVFSGKSIPSPLADRPYAVQPEPLAVPEWKAGTDSTYTLPEGIASTDRVGRVIPGEISLDDEMLTPDDFSDTNIARTRGTVFYNPNRKMGVRGVIPLPFLYTSSQPSKNLSPGVSGLAEGLRELTDITVSAQRTVYLQQNTVFEYPFLYIACDEQWEYLPEEAKKMGKYLRSGGFALLEDLTPWVEQSPGEASLRQFIRDALVSGVRFEPIPHDHPLYHCYFDFDDGPPLGVEMKALDSVGASMNRQKELEGVWLNGRLAAVFSGKGYGTLWMRRGNNDPQLKMGVNFVVFALLQEGGKAEKRQDGTLDPGIMSRRNSAGMASSPASGSGKSSASVPPRSASPQHH